MILEVIAIRREDVEIAYEGGADRIELVSGIAEGGLTPSIGLVEAAVKASPLPVNVMVRPHSQSFCYSKADIAIMLRDIEAIREAGAAGIVLGALNDGGGIDHDAVSRLLDAAEGLDVTFHRAFDETADMNAAMRELARYPQIRRVLTAGGLEPAPQAAAKLGMLRKTAEEAGMIIMGGYGLHAGNIGLFVRETGIREVHVGSGARRARSFQEPLLAEEVKRIRTILDTAEPR
ncbi:copper homeostasis protein CutC [Paenibacillus soyae]|uniref:PF03932 family protein CutC n=1 Tax=Paenibacillus soyae TaxID=2969249 RepID=A0A9X2MPB5_9BACL|nr:copper homeostasis protein CutC [Paenibacillus soyae]MCR2803955.1 copper homeostasis protein CutC [Paenibacillus soyae]